MLEALINLLSSGVTLVPEVMALIAAIRAQPGMEDSAIIAHARKTTDETTALIIAERLRLLAEIAAQEGSPQ